MLSECRLSKVQKHVLFISGLHCKINLIMLGTKQLQERRNSAPTSGKGSEKDNRRGKRSRKSLLIRGTSGWLPRAKECGDVVLEKQLKTPSCVLQVLGNALLLLKGPTRLFRTWSKRRPQRMFYIQFSPKELLLMPKRFFVTKMVCEFLFP